MSSDPFKPTASSATVNMFIILALPLLGFKVRSGSNKLTCLCHNPPCWFFSKCLASKSTLLESVSLQDGEILETPLSLFRVPETWFNCLASIAVLTAYFVYCKVVPMVIWMMEGIAQFPRFHFKAVPSWCILKPQKQVFFNVPMEKNFLIAFWVAFKQLFFGFDNDCSLETKTVTTANAQNHSQAAHRGIP